MYYGPKVVTDGLALYLDAGNPRSYPGTGTTWSDLSGNGNNGTLVNGVGYNGGNLGSLVFDGLNDHVNAGDCSVFFPVGNQSHNISINAWWKGSSAASSNELFMGLLNANDRLYLGRNGGFWEFGWGTQHWGTSFTGSRTSSTNNWTNYVFVVNSGTATLYINGIQAQSRTDTSVSLSGIFPIGAYFNTETYAIESGPCQIALTSIYNRTLSQAEIQQNFSATRRRFGL